MNLIWVLIFVALIIIEILTINLVTIWFAVGAGAAFLVSLFNKSVLLQSTIFIVVSTISLFITKSILKNAKNKDKEKTNLDRVLGQVGIVTEKINGFEPGEVKVDGKKWSAVANKEIEIGKKVKILSIDGVKLNVKEMESVS